MENLILDQEEIVVENDYRDFLAPKWKRFVNFLFDFYAIYILSQLLFILILTESSLSYGTLKLLLICCPLLTTYSIYCISEALFGKTLGKLITGCKVISVDDEPLRVKQIIYRTLCRIVPFEPFSLLFGYTAWHDDWSDTAVVNNSFKIELN